MFFLHLGLPRIIINFIIAAEDYLQIAAITSHASQKHNVSIALCLAIIKMKTLQSVPLDQNIRNLAAS